MTDRERIAAIRTRIEQYYAIDPLDTRLWLTARARIGNSAPADLRFLIDYIDSQRND